MKDWDKDEVQRLIELLGEEDFDRKGAIGRAVAKLGTGRTQGAARKAFAGPKFRKGTLSQYLRGAPNRLDAIPPPPATPTMPSAPDTASDTVEGAEQKQIEALVKATKKEQVPFEQLCDDLDLSPKRLRELIEVAQGRGFYVETSGDRVGWRVPPPRDDIQDIGVPPVIGETQRVGVFSDLHLGSKYCLRPQLREFVQHAYDSGVREILCPGDVLDGCYKHGQWELTHHGLDAQTEDLFETLPELPGLKYHAITGNHDQTFEDKAGLDVGKHIEAAFRLRGRTDLRFHGNRGAFLRVRGALVHLWHPKKGSGYALSYGLQKQVEKYSPGQKPQILLTGHWHIFCHIAERGIEAIGCPTFQGGGSSFGKSLGGSPTMGGLILSWDLTEHRTMRGFQIEARRYFEKEQLHDIEAGFVVQGAA